MKNAKKMSLPLFCKWMQDNVKCELRQTSRRLEAVINADVIEPGTFAALIAIIEEGELLISELTERFASPGEAFIALESVQEETIDLVPFTQWMQDQYWSTKDLKVEMIRF